MVLTVSARLGHRDVLIGEGGMGQVWQASDTVASSRAEPAWHARATTIASLTMAPRWQNVSVLQAINGKRLRRGNPTPAVGSRLWVSAQP